MWKYTGISSGGPTETQKDNIGITYITYSGLSFTCSMEVDVILYRNPLNVFSNLLRKKYWCW
jgi:hypothetical protein